MFSVDELKVIRSKTERSDIARSMHDGLGDSQEAEALGGHTGRDKTIGKILERFLLSLYFIFTDVKQISVLVIPSLH